MRVLIAVDDTDDLTKETSTGLIASLLSAELQKRYAVSVHLGITRHQLLLQEEVPYTSHNSVMCVEVSGEVTLEQILELGAQVVRRHMAPAANPGLCVCRVDRITHPEALIRFGQQAQRVLLEKGEAHALLRRLDHVKGLELGGTGQGLIGAVAGVGLRLSGNDGTFRGKVKFPVDRTHMAAGDWKARFQAADVVDLRTGRSLADGETVTAHGFAKLFFRQHRKIAFAFAGEDGIYQLASREQALELDGGRPRRPQAAECGHFVYDNDSNECITGERRCENCLYRRQLQDGFLCRCPQTFPHNRSVR